MLQGVGLSGLTAFASLYFAARSWGHAGLVMTAFGIGFIFVRVVLGHLPDRMSGYRVALWSLIVEAIGQAMLWGAAARDRRARRCAGHRPRLRAGFPGPRRGGPEAGAAGQSRQRDGRVRCFPRHRLRRCRAGGGRHRRRVRLCRRLSVRRRLRASRCRARGHRRQAPKRVDIRNERSTVTSSH